MARVILFHNRESSLSAAAQLLPNRSTPLSLSASVLCAEMPFEQAIDLYLDMRREVPMSARAMGAHHEYGYAAMGNRRRRRAVFLTLNTARSYAQYAESLKLFFAGWELGAIRLSDLQLYQHARHQGLEPFIRYRRPQDAQLRHVGDNELPAKGKTSCPVKAKKVNQELGLLQMLMKHAGAWSEELNEHYAPLDEDEGKVPRALTPEEQEHWLRTAASSQETEIVFWYSLIAFHTLNSTDEMRSYRIGDWNLQQRVAIVRKGKVRARERTIEITDPDALWAMERLLDRAKQCGATEYNHFIFPRRGRGPHGEWDPGRPMSNSGLKGPWNQVREHSGLLWFRPYDPRHTGITRLAEDGVPIAVIKERAGHITDKMSRHYTHISQGVQRRWMEFAQKSRWARQQPALQPAAREGWVKSLSPSTPYRTPRRSRKSAK